MQRLISNPKSIVTLVLTAALLLTGLTFSGNAENRKVEGSRNLFSQDFQPSGLMLADDWDCDDFI